VEDTPEGMVQELHFAAAEESARDGVAVDETLCHSAAVMLAEFHAALRMVAAGRMGAAEVGAMLDPVKRFWRGLSRPLE
jgi:hypothetical protein